MSFNYGSSYVFEDLEICTSFGGWSIREGRELCCGIPLQLDTAQKGQWLDLSKLCMGLGRVCVWESKLRGLLYAKDYWPTWISITDRLQVLLLLISHASIPMVLLTRQDYLGICLVGIKMWEIYSFKNLDPTSPHSKSPFATRTHKADQNAEGPVR